jgi:hypothetical protein
MNRDLPAYDSLPWYRQFWPWFLIMLPASVVVAGFYTLYLANRYSDDLVVDDYYKNGLAINRQLEKKQRAVDLGISAQLQFSKVAVTVQMAGPVDAAELQLLMSHPLESDRDFAVVLMRVDPGLYSGILQQAVAPRWHWTLQSEHAQSWRLDGSVKATDIGNAAID